MIVALAVDGNPRFRLLTRVLIRSLRTHHPDIQIVVMDSSGGDSACGPLDSEGCRVIEARPAFDKVLGPVDSSAAYFRLDIPQIFSEDYVLYLDVDMLCVGSIEEVLESRPACAAMVDEETRSWARSRALLAYLEGRQHLHYTYEGQDYYIPLSRESKTYNSGLMVIHAARWREESIGQRICKMIADNEAAIAPYGDQVAINAFLGHYPHCADLESSLKQEKAYGPLKRTVGSHLKAAIGRLEAPKRAIQELSTRFNATPCVQGTEQAAIIHYRGPKPWEEHNPKWEGMTGAPFLTARNLWLEYLSAEERERVAAWEKDYPR